MSAADMDKLVPCPCCGKGKVVENHEYDICEVCGWEDDPLQFQEPDYRGGANSMSLNEAKLIFRETGKRIK